MNSKTTRILLVDDEQPVQKLLSYPLEKEGYEVVPALDGQEALANFEEGQFDLVVLDIMLPKIDGLEVCRRLRAKSSVPIIMLTAKAEEIDKVLGLELGADMAPDGEVEEEPLVRGDLRIDFEKRSTELAGKPIDLTYVEFEIVAVL